MARRKTIPVSTNGHKSLTKEYLSNYGLDRLESAVVPELDNRRLFFKPSRISAGNVTSFFDTKGVDQLKIAADGLLKVLANEDGSMMFESQEEVLKTVPLELIPTLFMAVLTSREDSEGSNQ